MATLIKNDCRDCPDCVYCGKNFNYTVDVCDHCETEFNFDEKEYHIKGSSLCKECAKEYIEENLMDEVLKDYEV